MPNSLPPAPPSAPASATPPHPTPAPAFQRLVALAEARAPARMLSFLSQACARDQQRRQGSTPLSATGEKLCWLEASMILFGNSASRKEQRTRRLVLRLARAVDGQDPEELARAVRAVWAQSKSAEERKRRPILAAILKRIAQQQRAAPTEM